MIKFCKIFIFFISFVFCNYSFSQDNSDFDLKSSLESVLKNHRVIKASGIDIKAAELRLKQAKGGYYPSFDLKIVF